MITRTLLIVMFICSLPVFHKIELSLGLTEAIKNNCMMTYGEEGLRLHSFLTSALIGEWSASGPSPFIPKERD